MLLGEGYPVEGGGGHATARDREEEEEAGLASHCFGGKGNRKRVAARQASRQLLCRAPPSPTAWGPHSMIIWPVDFFICARAEERCSMLGPPCLFNLVPAARLQRRADAGSSRIQLNLRLWERRSGRRLGGVRGRQSRASGRARSSSDDGISSRDIAPQQSVRDRSKPQTSAPAAPESSALPGGSQRGLGATEGAVRQPCDGDVGDEANVSVARHTHGGGDDDGDERMKYHHARISPRQPFGGKGTEAGHQGEAPGPDRQPLTEAPSFLGRRGVAMMGQERSVARHELDVATDGPPPPSEARSCRIGHGWRAPKEAARPSKLGGRQAHHLCRLAAPRSVPSRAAVMSDVISRWERRMARRSTKQANDVVPAASAMCSCLEHTATSSASCTTRRDVAADENRPRHAYRCRTGHRLLSPWTVMELACLTRKGGPSKDSDPGPLGSGTVDEACTSQSLQTSPPDMIGSTGCHDSPRQRVRPDDADEEVAVRVWTHV
ncbi:hypothetical protein DCS_06969 [Drechmeria coniospora]|uniref:Uncharacterized protein n=1 Tax=Drechmeria coniospora TaxID=98403 RepID=A0A151GD27_DRECN|nr:hypothetical protein DCS_06969 [Drechmeria coniospora]KYK55008.1 hypothetical protein DCS_06969 [Drechmeria coniospora]